MVFKFIREVIYGGEVLCILKMLCLDVLIGFDGIFVKFVKLVVDIIVSFLIVIINNCIRKLVWKNVRISFIFKIDNFLLEEYFRFIFILFVLLKIFEKFVGI